MRRAFRLCVPLVLLIGGLGPAVLVTAGTTSASASASAASHAAYRLSTWHGTVSGSAASSSAIPGGRRLWVRRFTGGTGWSGFGTSVAASPNRSMVYVTGTTELTSTGRRRDYSTVAYNTFTGAPVWVARYEGTIYHPFGNPHITVSPDGFRVFVAGEIPSRGIARNYLVLAYNAITGALLWTAQSAVGNTSIAPGTPLAVSPDSATVYVTGSPYRGPDRTFAFSAATGRQLWAAFTTFRQPVNQEKFIAASPNGSAVFVTGSDGTVAYNATTGTTLWTDHYKERWQRSPQGLAVSPDSSALFVTSPARTRGSTPRDTIRTTAYNATTGARLWAARYYGPGNGASPDGLALSPDGSRVFVTGSVSTASGTSHQETLAYNAANGAFLWAVSSAGVFPAFIAVSPDGSKVFVTGGASNQYLTIGFDAATGAQLWTASLSGLAGAFTTPLSMAVGPDSSRVFVTGSSSSPQVFGPSEYLTVAYQA